MGLGVVCHTARGGAAALAGGVSELHSADTPHSGTGAAGCGRSPREANFHPLVLLRVYPLPQALTRIQQLPATEYPNAFRALLSVFRVADDHRRRTQCQHGCSHDWHNLPPLPPTIPTA